ncbi:RidA family protein [Phyllobacterium sp. K27]
MEIQRFEVDARLSGVVIHNNTVYLSGQVGEGETVDDQCQFALREIDRRLALAGTSKTRILQTLVYLADISDFEEMNAAWMSWIDPRNPPARATCEAKLALPAIKVEFIVTAAL